MRARAYIHTYAQEGSEEGPITGVRVGSVRGPLIAHEPFMDPWIRERKSSSVCSFAYTLYGAREADMWEQPALRIDMHARGLICPARAFFRISDPDPDRDFAVDRIGVSGSSDGVLEDATPS